ncbi:unnamed protein product [Symbiodinium pilosum]|uniref:Uncharacterized protein n=1 Tax=Symbiodinium pilosum TaxID=2952 RepID=A0A812UH79_SYMPI|nr:unnamed protein product [Symbiodinium pilosum]
MAKDDPLDNPLDAALPDDDVSGDDYDRDEDFDGDYQGGEGLELKGPEELAMDFDVFGRYVQSSQTENGKPVFLGPKTEGARPSIAFTLGGDDKPTWWICDASGGECFYAECDADRPPRTGWRNYSDAEVELVLEARCQQDSPAICDRDQQPVSQAHKPVEQNLRDTDFSSWARVENHHADKEPLKAIGEGNAWYEDAMAAFSQLWEYWHARQYEQAASEACRLVAVVAVEEETLQSEADLLAAAGAVHAFEHGQNWSEEQRSVALLGRNCCNRVAERHLRSGNWHQAARWCAIAWRLEGGESFASLWLEDGSWAAARFQRLFHAAEAFRLAGKGKTCSHPERQAYLQASRRCLDTCEVILQRCHP